MNKTMINRIMFSFITIFMFFFVIYSCNNVFAEVKVFTLNDVSIIEKSDSVSGNITNRNNNMIDNDIVFHKLNDYVTYKLVISNNTDSQITINSIINKNSDQYIEYQYDNHEGDIVEPNGTFELIIKAIYKNEQSDYTKRDYSNTIDFIISYLDENNNSGSITINPKTNDNIQTNIAILIISSVGLTICLLY